MTSESGTGLPLNPFASRTELMEALLMGHSDAVCALDLNDRILFVNPAAAELLGGTVENLIGRSQQEVFGDRVYAETQKQLDERLQGRSTTYELGFYDNQGQERTLLVTGSALKDPEGRVVGSFGVLKDITDRKLREQALETRLLLDQAVIESARTFALSEHLFEALDQSLGALSILLNAEQVRFFELRNNKTFICTHQWPPEATPEESEVGQSFPVDTYPWWLRRLRQGNVFYNWRGDPLPADALAERDTMASRGLTSIIGIPLLVGDALQGYVTFENPAPYGCLEDGDLTNFHVYGELLAATMVRQRG